MFCHKCNDFISLTKIIIKNKNSQTAFSKRQGWHCSLERLYFAPVLSSIYDCSNWWSRYICDKTWSFVVIYEIIAAGLMIILQTIYDNNSKFLYFSLYHCNLLYVGLFRISQFNVFKRLSDSDGFLWLFTLFLDSSWIVSPIDERCLFDEKTSFEVSTLSIISCLNLVVLETPSVRDLRRLIYKL
jgi:hypothetical protein